MVSRSWSSAPGLTLRGPRRVAVPAWSSRSWSPVLELTVLERRRMAVPLVERRVVERSTIGPPGRGLHVPGATFLELTVLERVVWECSFLELTGLELAVLGLIRLGGPGWAARRWEQLVERCEQSGQPRLDVGLKEVLGLLHRPSSACPGPVVGRSVTLLCSAGGHASDRRLRISSAAPAGACPLYRGWSWLFVVLALARWPTSGPHWRDIPRSWPSSRRSWWPQRCSSVPPDPTPWRDTGRPPPRRSWRSERRELLKIAFNMG